MENFLKTAKKFKISGLKKDCRELSSIASGWGSQVHGKIFLKQPKSLKYQA